MSWSLEGRQSSNQPPLGLQIFQLLFSNHLPSGNNSEYRLSKRCEDMCPDTQVDLKPGAPSTNCCNFSFCNMSGATSVKTSTAAVALGIVASFFFIFQSRL